MRVSEAAKIMFEALDTFQNKTEWHEKRKAALDAYREATTKQQACLDGVYAAQLKRLHEALCTKTQVQLADKLGLRQSSISDANRRQSVPSSWVETAFREFRVNPDFIRRGEAPMFFALGKEG